MTAVGKVRVKLSMTRPPDLSRLSEAQKNVPIRGLWAKVEEHDAVIADLPECVAELEVELARRLQGPLHRLLKQNP
ncbi:MAG: hypothetical protein IIC82_02595 [Chloroflexi bacterium]|nr:hypothetical protein [Chloroflexota bacterium]